MSGALIRLVGAGDINLRDISLEKAAKATEVAESTQGECMDGEEEKPQGCAPKPSGGWRRKSEQRRSRKSMWGCRKTTWPPPGSLHDSLDLRSLYPRCSPLPTPQCSLVTLLCPFCLQGWAHLYVSLIVTACLPPLHCELCEQSCGALDNCCVPSTTRAWLRVATQYTLLNERKQTNLILGPLTPLTKKRALKFTRKKIVQVSYISHYFPYVGLHESCLLRMILKAPLFYLVKPCLKFQCCSVLP